MKTKIPYSIFVAFLMIPAFVFSNTNTDWKEKHTKEKIIKKEFSVNEDATLKVHNSYGNIDVVTWNENRIEIEVTIRTNSKDAEKAKTKLDDITVDFESSPSMVSAKTKFNKGKSNSWWNWGNNKNVSMEINYVIKMPITNNVEFTNDYGSINLDKLQGRANINCDYGKITTKELMADNNNISFDYTHDSYFEYINSGTIKADYSDYTVSKTKSLDIKADYTKSIIEIAEDISYNCDYGSLNINNVNNVNGKGDYLTMRLGNVYKNVTIKADYGSLKIDKLTAKANDILIDSDYVGIKIGYDDSYSFNFDLNLKNASLRDSDGLQINKEQKNSGNNYYSGFHGNANSGNTIKITSEYGSVTLYKN